MHFQSALKCQNNFESKGRTSRRKATIIKRLTGTKLGHRINGTEQSPANDGSSWEELGFRSTQALSGGSADVLRNAAEATGYQHAENEP